jgi:hypothetical protein
MQWRWAVTRQKGLAMSITRQDGTRVPKFALGRVAATPCALELLRVLGIEAARLLDRDQSGDRGTVSPEDAALNEGAAAAKLRVFSSYRLQLTDNSAWPHRKQVLWVITEADPSATTLLLPEEY